MNIHLPRADVTERTLAIVGELKGLEGPLIPILHEIQDESAMCRRRACR